ncbi:MAG: hypothetical protein R3A79_16260 [Nannocystaceae bacterium]
MLKPLLAASLLLTACGGASSRPDTRDARTEAATASRDPTPPPTDAAPPGDVAAARLGNAPPSAPPKAPAPAPAPASDEASATSGEPPAAPEEPPPLAPTASQAEADAICRDALVLDEEATLTACKLLPGGVALPGGGRVDVVEIEYDGMDHGETKEAHVVMRVGGSVSTQVLGEQYEIAGQSVSYTLGALRLEGDAAVIASTHIEHTFPNTGEPDADPEDYQEIVERTTRCEFPDGTCSAELGEPRTERTK